MKTIDFFKLQSKNLNFLNLITKGAHGLGPHDRPARPTGTSCPDSRPGGPIDLAHASGPVAPATRRSRYAAAPVTPVVLVTPGDSRGPDGSGGPAVPVARSWLKIRGSLSFAAVTQVSGVRALGTPLARDACGSRQASALWGRVWRARGRPGRRRPGRWPGPR